MMPGPGGLLSVVCHLFAVPVLVFIGGVAKEEYITKPGCEIYFWRVPY
jgi:hypothetical protein